MARFSTSPSQIMSLRVREMQAAGEDIVKLTQGEPEFPTPDHIKQAAIAAMAADDTKYPPVAGTAALRQAVAEKFKADNGLDYAANEIVVGAGAKQILFDSLMALVDDGDEAVIAAPYWTSYPDMVRLAGGTPVIVDTELQNGHKMTPAELDRALGPKTKILMMNSPCNPTGAVYDADELAGLADVLRGYPEVIVLSDDIYEHLIFDGKTFSTLAQVAPDLRDRTITINGVSKAHAMTGWRIGFAGGPAPLIAGLVKIQSQSTGGISTISQAAAVEALRGNQDHVGARTAILAARRDRLLAAVKAIDGLDATRPDGALYLYCRCEGVIGTTSPTGRRIESDNDFAEYLIEEAGVAVVAGAAYGLSPYIRVSFTTSEADLDKAAARLADGVARLRR
jgi:aspartate aminotransferase